MRLVAVKAVVITMLISLTGFPQTPARFAVPKGLDRNAPEAVPKLANEAYDKKDHLVAEVYCRRLLALMPGNDLAMSCLQQIQALVATEKAALPVLERAKYEEFTASVLMPEAMAQGPAMRLSMNALLQEGDLDAAVACAEGILKVLPGDIVAGKLIKERNEAMFRKADAAWAAGDIPAAATLYSKLANDMPEAGAKLQEVEIALRRHDQ
jgi:tetratricopeptide (TPR) repeat protein